MAFHEAVADELGNFSESGLREAARMGVDMVALELHSTLDNHLVLAYKGSLYDEDDIEWPARNFALGALEALESVANVSFMTLPQALELCRREQVGVYLDIQDAGVLPDLVELLQSGNLTGDLAGYGIIGSFRPDWLADCKALLPQIPTAIQFASRRLDAVPLAQSIEANYLHPRWERYPRSKRLARPRVAPRGTESRVGHPLLARGASQADRRFVHSRAGWNL